MVKISEFFESAEKSKVEFYNEFNFQHEIGFWLRKKLNKKYKVEFERNVDHFGLTKSEFPKKEIDLVIYEKDKRIKYAIELKFPTNGQYPEQIYKSFQDIKFLEQLVKKGFKCWFIFLTRDKLFYEGKTEGIYKYFRKPKENPINGKISKPTGTSMDSIVIQGSYKIKWQNLENRMKYFCIRIKLKNRKK